VGHKPPYYTTNENCSVWFRPEETWEVRACKGGEGSRHGAGEKMEPEQPLQDSAASRASQAHDS